MSLFSEQALFCCICGTPFRSTVQGTFYNGNQGNFSDATCKKECWDEKKWRETLSIMGKPYYLDPKKNP